MNRLPKSLPYFLIFITLPLLAFPDLFFNDQTLYWTDLSWIHYPRHHFAAEEWLAGRIPLWDPYGDTGIPLLAESQVGVLYPFSLLFLSSLPHTLELSLFIVLHFSLAMSFTYGLGRALNLSRPAAALSALAYGAGGFLMAQLPNLNIMTAAVWLPLILWGLKITLDRHAPAFAMLTGVALTMQIVTAQPQMVFYTLLTLGGYGLYRLSSEKGFRLNMVGLLLLMLMTGILLAAPQLLPTFEQQQQSIRHVERSFDFLTDTSWPPIMALNLLLPSGFGNNVVGFKMGDPFQEVFIYVGYLTLMLMPFSWSQRRRPDAPFYMGLLVVGLLLALGRHTPLYAWVIQYLPGFALFRIPARWLMVVNLALAMLAGMGLEHLLSATLRKRAWGVITAVNLLLGLHLLIGWQWPSELSSHALQQLQQYSYQVSPIYQQKSVLSWLWPLTIPAFLLLMNLIATQLLMTLYHHQRLTARWFGRVAISLLMLDLIVAGGVTINPTQPNSWWHDLSGGGRYVQSHLPPSERVFPLGMGSEQATVSHFGQYFPSVYHVRSAGGHGSSLRSARYEQFVDESHPVLALQLLGVRYLLTEGQLGADAAATYPLVYQDDRSLVYENPQPMPRAYIVPQAIFEDDETAILEHLRLFDFEIRQYVLLEGVDNSLREVFSTQQTGTNSSSATIILDTPQAVVISTQTEQPSYLVLLDAYAPGWVATINQQTVPIYRANYLYRAIALPAGEQTVSFEYRPLSFRIGLGIAGSMVIFMLGYGIILWKIRKPSA